MGPGRNSFDQGPFHSSPYGLASAQHAPSVMTETARSSVSVEGVCTASPLGWSQWQPCRAEEPEHVQLQQVEYLTYNGSQLPIYSESYLHCLDVAQLRAYAILLYTVLGQQVVRTSVPILDNELLGWIETVYQFHLPELRVAADNGLQHWSQQQPPGPLPMSLFQPQLQPPANLLGSIPGLPTIPHQQRSLNWPQDPSGISPHLMPGSLGGACLDTPLFVGGSISAPRWESSQHCW